MTKKEQYDFLVKERKKCRLCMGDCTSKNLNDFDCWNWFAKKIKENQEAKVIVNPSFIPKEARTQFGEVGPSAELDRWDPDVISYWESWQGNINSNIVLVGQDWGGFKYYLMNGANESGFDKGNNTNPTNKNIIQLFASIGIIVDPPGVKEVKAHHLYFTNAILCTKNGKLNGKTMPEWFENCRKKLALTIDMVRPKIVISLGEKATDSILRAHLDDMDKEKEINDYLRLSWPEKVSKSIQIGNFTLYPVYHCGAQGKNINREWKLQLADWSRIKKHPDWAEICRSNLEQRSAMLRGD